MKKILFICFISIFCFIENIFGLESGKNLIIKIKDNEYKDIILEKVKDKKFTFFKNNWGYADLVFNDTDTIIFNNLEYGNYVIKPISIEGFKTDYYEYRVLISEISDENGYVYINYEPIKGRLIINKYFGSENNYNLDNNAIFEIYKDNKLIKSVKPENGTIKETLEYGNYLIKQTGGEKYYNLAEEFSVEIKEEKNYEYNLYTEIDLNLEQTFNEKEEALNKKEKDLLELEKNLNEKNNKLLELEKIVREKEKVYELEVEKKNNEIKKLQEQINQLNINDISIVNLKNTISKLEKELSININLLKQEKLNILDKENIIKKLEEELFLIKNKKEITVQTNKKEGPLVVEVPNTSKKSLNMSLLLIFIGSLFLVFGIKKVTSH